MDIMAFLICLNNCIDKTTLRRLSCIVDAMLSMTGRVTMLGVSRWTEKGGSYRTIQRFFNTTITWYKINWFLIRKALTGMKEILLIADETVVTKSGKHTFGVDRFFSSILNKPVSSISFFSLSLLDVQNGTSYSIMTEQIEKEKKKTENKGKKKKSKKKKNSDKKASKGRKKGSKNKDKKNVELSSYLLWAQGLIRKVLNLIGAEIELTIFVFDGAFGNNESLQMVKQCGLELISKLRHDSALWFPYTGNYAGRGPYKKYGDKLDYANIPEIHLVSIETKGNIETCIYNIQLWHKNFPELLNIVVIKKNNLMTNKVAHVVLFSSDLELHWEKIITYYRLRFQIEFNFRDAKQHWGLEDFMNINQKPVYNGANLSMFMVNFSQILLQNQSAGLLSMNDLKTWFRGHKYMRTIIKLLPKNTDQTIIQELQNELSGIGRINLVN